MIKCHFRQCLGNKMTKITDLFNYGKCLPQINIATAVTSEGIRSMLKSLSNTINITCMTR